MPLNVSECTLYGVSLIGLLVEFLFWEVKGLNDTAIEATSEHGDLGFLRLLSTGEEYEHLAKSRHGVWVTKEWWSWHTDLKTVTILLHLVLHVEF